MPHNQDAYVSKEEKVHAGKFKDIMKEGTDPNEILGGQKQQQQNLSQNQQQSQQSKQSSQL